MQFKGSRSGGPLHWEKEGGGPQQLVAPLTGQRCSQAISFLVLFKVLLCSSLGRPLPLSAGWVLAVGTTGLWVSPGLGVPAGSSSVPSQPGLGTCQGSLSGGKSSGSPSGSWMQPVWDPSVTLVPFITLLLPPRHGVAGRVLCYVQLGNFCLSGMCLCLGFCSRSQCCPGMAALLPACLCNPVVEQDSGLSRGFQWDVRVPKASGLPWALAGVDVAVSRGITGNQVMPPGSPKRLQPVCSWLFSLGLIQKRSATEGIFILGLEVLCFQQH